MLDVNTSLQVKTERRFDWAASILDLHGRDHVMQRALRITFGFKLPGIRELLPNLLDDHVKHGFEHVELCAELPCFRVITSSFV